MTPRVVCMREEWSGDVLDTLQNFAEVGIAVAGFSGIVSAVSARSLSPRERDHLIALLQTSGLVVAFALVPQVLSAVLVEDRSLWLTSSILYLAVHLIHYGNTAFKMLRSIGSGKQDTIGKRDAYVTGAVATLLLVAQITAILFGDSTQMLFVYLVILLWHTGTAMAMFGSLLIRALSRRGASESA